MPIGSPVVSIEKRNAKLVKVIYLDTETTGLDPKANGIIQLAAWMEIDGETKDRFNVYMKPWDGCVYTEEAMKTNGISCETIDAAKSELEVYGEFKSWMDHYINRYDKQDRAFLCGYNVGFDDNFLRALADRCGDKYLGSYKWSSAWDVMSEASIKLAEDRPNMPNFKLETVARHVLGDNAVDEILKREGHTHDAMVDVVITRELHRALVRKD